VSDCDITFKDRVKSSKLVRQDFCLDFFLSQFQLATFLSFFTNVFQVFIYSRLGSF
jgi:hypothetical protein